MPAAVPRPNNLDAFWMPYTDNRYFKGTPRMLARAEGMHYVTPEGREILDGTAGLWCCNAGHGRREIVEAIQRQAAVMDFAPASRRSRRRGWTASSSPTPAARARTRR
jgi:beta-alanine--pyruvate transaminase